MAKKVNADLHMTIPRGKTIVSHRMDYDAVSPPCLERYNGLPFLDMGCTYDYVRYRALELMKEQIENLPGSVAELGVFEGNFAQMINYLFPKKTLFLYDTFQGFDERDCSLEQEQQFSKEALSGDLKPLASDPIEAIRERCPYSENLVFRKGYFPETAAPDKNETFSFVSLDADLYKPTHAGLEFFYPRMQEGGVIFVHDYSSGMWKGVKEAIQDAEKIFGPFKKVPLPDCCGTLVIVK
jgi:O-methyltransferase